MLLHRAVASLLLLGPQRNSVIQCSDTEDAASRLKKAAESIDITSGAADAASTQLEELQRERARRLEAMGASSLPSPPPGAPPPRSTFSVSDASQGRKDADEALRRMRRKETGELEVEHADQIDRALRVATQWLDAGLSERAWTELQSVVKLVSFKSEVGAAYHLRLANVADKCGRTSEAKRLRLRVMADALSSSQRWQAERDLQKGSGGSAPSTSSSSSSTQEMSNLFGGFGDWGKQ